MDQFTEDELSSIHDMATERADALRGYMDNERIQGEEYWRGMAAKADRLHGRRVRARFENATEEDRAHDVLGALEGIAFEVGLIPDEDRIGTGLDIALERAWQVIEVAKA